MKNRIIIALAIWAVAISVYATMQTLEVKKQTQIAREAQLEAQVLRAAQRQAEEEARRARIIAEANNQKERQPAPKKGAGRK